jgi:hypothetical protein
MSLCKIEDLLNKLLTIFLHENKKIDRPCYDYYKFTDQKYPYTQFYLYTKIEDKYKVKLMMRLYYYKFVNVSFFRTWFHSITKSLTCKQIAWNLKEYVEEFNSWNTTNPYQCSIDGDFISIVNKNEHTSTTIHRDLFINSIYPMFHKRLLTYEPTACYRQLMYLCTHEKNSDDNSLRSFSKIPYDFYLPDWQYISVSKAIMLKSYFYNDVAFYPKIKNKIASEEDVVSSSCKSFTTFETMLVTEKDSEIKSLSDLLNFIKTSESIEDSYISVGHLEKISKDFITNFFVTIVYNYNFEQCFSKDKIFCQSCHDTGCSICQESYYYYGCKICKTCDGFGSCLMRENFFKIVPFTNFYKESWLNTFYTDFENDCDENPPKKRKVIHNIFPEKELRKNHLRNIGISRVHDYLHQKEVMKKYQRFSFCQKKCQQLRCLNYKQCHNTVPQKILDFGFGFCTSCIMYVNGDKYAKYCKYLIYVGKRKAINHSKISECPICLEGSSSVGIRFSCDHGICHSCYRQWFYFPSDEIPEYEIENAEKYFLNPTNFDALSDNNVEPLICSSIHNFWSRLSRNNKCPLCRNELFINSLY